MTNHPPDVLIDARHFRNVMGQFPTGVAVISALDADGRPCGMAVGSFSSVSLDPPLVAFMPARSSSTFPRIAATGSFCVSVLGADQEGVCRTFATSGGDKFSGLDWIAAPSGAPIITGALAWMDCLISDVHDAGDHLIVVGAVTALSEMESGPPLVFFRGGYGGFAPSSLVAAPEPDFMEPVRLAGLARTAMERLARDLDLEAQATAAVRGQFVLLALADSPQRQYTRSRVGYRTPLVYPVGAVLVAWEATAARADWLPADPQLLAQAELALQRVRERRWSISLGGERYDDLERAVGQLTRDGYEVGDSGPVGTLIAVLPPEHFDPVLDPDGRYDVRMITAPVFYPGGGVALALGVRGFATPMTQAQIEAIATRLVTAADELTARISGPV